MNQILIDFGTLRSAKNAVECLRHEGPKDAEIVSLSCFLEYILLFEEIAVLNVGHRSSSQLIEFAGGIVKLKDIDAKLADNVESKSIEWLSEFSNFEQVLRICGFYQLEHYAGSNQFAVGATLGLSKALLSSKDVNNASKKDNYGFFPEEEEQWISSDIIEQRKKSSVSIKNREKFVKAWCTLEQQLLKGNADINFYNICWLLFRSRYYELYSRELGIDYAPHPIRSDVVLNSRLNSGNTIPSTVFYALRKSHQQSVEFVNESLGIQYQPIVVAPILPLLVKKSKHPNDIIEEAYLLRETDAVKALRDAFGKVRNAIYNGDLNTAISYSKQLTEIEKFMKSFYKLENVGSNVSISVFGINFNLPDRIAKGANVITSGVKLKSLLFLKDVFLEMQKSHSLGIYRDFFRYRK